MFKRHFTEHPASVGETYAQHMNCAFGFGVKMVLGGLACMVHAVIPFLFERTASNYVRQLNDTLVINRDRRRIRRASQYETASQ